MFSPFQIESVLKQVQKYPETLVIVEGKKDKEAISKLGFESILDISGKTLEETANIVSSKDVNHVIILTDFDEAGEDKASRLAKLFTHYKIKTVSSIRTLFKSLKISQIEEITSFTKLLEDDYHGKTCPIYNKIFNRSRVLGRRNNRKARHNRSDFRSDRGVAWSGS